MNRYSKRTIIEAGKAVANSGPDVTPDLIDAFRIAHDWRYGHLVPMRRVRRELSDKARRVANNPVLTAGRLKRFQSIRAKLKRGNLTLYQMQDLGGARAIMSSADQARRLTQWYVDGGSKFELANQGNDYWEAPKADGYRSRHLILRVDEPEETGGNRIVVELQIRTKLQHSWATAVEAVGLVRGENLKAGQGNADWLRFFAVASGEFAAEEQQPMIPGVSSDREERRAELRDIADRLDAIGTLESYNRAIRQTEGFLNLKGQSYLVRYDATKRGVEVSSYSNFSRLQNDAFREEISNQHPDTVVIELDKVGDLRSAYPNYFLDVRMFSDRIKSVIFESVPTKVLAHRRASKWAPFLDFLRRD
ncbi:MAG: RelA/SpoT domain-containing protein [Caulobacteraceae bacterium]|nr:RelA/SpoT domain-containing protein [Caulobacteraceae bacterium]